MKLKKLKTMLLKNDFLTNVREVVSRTPIHPPDRFENIETQSLDVCPVCRSPQKKLVKAPKRYKYLPESVVCGVCETWYLTNPLNDENLQGHGKHGGELVFNARPNDEAYYDKAFSLMYSRASNYYHFIKEYLEAGPGQSYLEVTSQYGGGVQFMIDKGIDAYGIDADVASSRYSKKRLGNRVYFGDVTDFNLKRTFNVISLPRVLNHYVDPSTIIRCVDKALDKSGIIFIENLDAIHAVFRKGLSRNLNLDHPINFSYKSMIQLLDNHGFIPVKVHMDSQGPGSFKSLNHMHIVAMRSNEVSDHLAVTQVYDGMLLDEAISSYESKRWVGEPVFYGAK